MWLTSLLLIALGTSQAAIPMVPMEPTLESSFQSKRPVREQIQASLMKLESTLQQSQNTNEKFRALQRSLSEIELIRDYGQPENRADKTHTDLTVAALHALPTEVAFKKDDCAKYESDFINQFDPLAEDEPQEPALQPAWDILKSLCQ